jgi:hypothetical protein
LYRNNPFLKLELSCVSNGTSCSTNSILELLYGGVGGAELKNGSGAVPSTPRSALNMFWKREAQTHIRLQAIMAQQTKQKHSLKVTGLLLHHPDMADTVTFQPNNFSNLGRVVGGRLMTVQEGKKVRRESAAQEPGGRSIIKYHLTLGLGTL